MLDDMENVVAAGVAGVPAALPISGLTALAPHATATIVDVDPAKVKEVRLAVRTPYELRQFSFGRKDKEWVDLSSLMDFTVDSPAELVPHLLRLADRYRRASGVPPDER